MGYGSYDASDWNKLKNSRGMNAQSSAQDIFKGNELQEKYLPVFIDKRESCDSEDSPLSTPIIIGFDVTGSMGYLAAEIAKNSLNKTITYIYDKQPVTNPHVMCAAFVEPYNKHGLQVTQADLTQLDAKCAKEIFGDNLAENLSLQRLYDMAQEQYEIYHIITGYNVQNALQTWQEFMPGRCAVIESEHISYLSEVITSIMQVCGGMKKNDVIRQWNKETQPVIQKALSTIGQLEADSPSESGKKGTGDGQVHTDERLSI